MVEHRPWRRPVVVLIILVTGTLGLGVGYLFGQQSLELDRDTHRVMVKELAIVKEKLGTVETQLIDAQLSATVQREAGNALREDLTREHEVAARLQEEVTFYKGLMSPSSLAKGLQVAELDLVALAEPRQFRYQLLLTQVALRRSHIAGQVRVDVIGRNSRSTGAGDPNAENNPAENREVVLSLTELTNLKAYPVKFRFRYFQDFAGEMTLPEGFEPERVLVTANQNGKEPLQVTFDWSLLGDRVGDGEDV